jgi:hypothetical protein
MVTKKKPPELKVVDLERETLEQLQVVVRRFQADQRARIAASNRFAAMVRYEIATKEEIADPAGPYQAAMKSLEANERKQIAPARKLLRSFQVWTQWMQHVRGVDYVLGAQIIGSGLDYTRHHVSCWYRYAGLDVVKYEYPLLGEMGRAPRRVPNQKITWNPKLRTTMFNFANCIERSGGAYKDRVYLPYKVRDRQLHPAPVETGEKSKKGEPIMLYTDGHIRQRAMRVTSKMFLSHLWQVWREIMGLPVNGPYPIERLGHTTVIDPWSMIEKKEPSSSRRTRKAERAIVEE